MFYIKWKQTFKSLVRDNGTWTIPTYGNLGTYNISTSQKIRKILKFIFGKQIQITLRGRGSRKIHIDPTRLGHQADLNQDLPLKLAKQAAVYFKMK